MKKSDYSRVVQAGRHFGLNPRSALAAFEGTGRPLKGNAEERFQSMTGGENAGQMSGKSLHMALATVATEPG